MTRRTFVAGTLLILTVGAVLRFAWLTSDPPTAAVVGVVWHDEGAWVHNARNRALWGAWRTDNWNPVYLAPVFTGLEYGAFRILGVGTWEARVVPASSGLIAIALLMAGLGALRGRYAALLGGALLAGNYVFVMWNRAALMESTMTSLIVVSWAAYALSERTPAWGLAAGAAAVLAFFTKASAAFFIAALLFEVLTTVALERRMTESLATRDGGAAAGALRAAAGVAIAAAVIGALFVLPHWSEFQFYNWQMSVTRKPEYSLHALLVRASWLPLVHDFFSWMWPLLVFACIGIVNVVIRWGSARPAHRLLVLWVVVGLIELIVHDSGNERRYVMFLPALIALAALWLVPFPGVSSSSDAIQPRKLWVVVPLLLGLGYLVAGSLVRVAFLEQIHAGHLHTTVVISTAAASLGVLLMFVRWRSWLAWLAVGRSRLPGAIAMAAVLLTLGIDLAHFTQWAIRRQDLNYQASVEVGRRLAPGTLVQGKLANGLSLENQIRPIFIGHGFGNYDDRLQRDDVRYILTYVSPSVGFESQAGSDLIQELLNRYPHRRTVATLTVNETGGFDRAALIDKVPGR